MIALTDKDFAVSLSVSRLTPFVTKPYQCAELTPVSVKPYQSRTPFEAKLYQATTAALI
jgi:hypothetical protein